MNIANVDFLIIIKICSSKLVSSEWIKSLFHRETAYMTPLDFRLTAAAQFRLLAMMCSDQTNMMDNTESSFGAGDLITPVVLFESSFNAQADALKNKFQAAMEFATTTNLAVNLIMLVIEQSQIHSALHTNILEFAVPSWYSFYPVVMTSYPVDKDASALNVSIFY